MLTKKSQYDRSGAVWTPGQLAFLKAGYPTGTPLKAIAVQVRHHPYEVRRKAEALGLPRGKPGPVLKSKAPTGLPENISPARFVAVGFKEVIRWMTKHGHKVEPGLKDGLWKVGCFDAQTPQMVVRLANDRRRRDHGLPPFQVDTGGRMPGQLSDTRIHSLMGSSMDMQLAGLGK